MLKKITLGFGVLTLLVQGAAFCLSTSVFVSFSMPAELIDEVFGSASRAQIPVYLNGLIDDDLRATLARVLSYGQKYPHLCVQIDPYAFERYHIDRVPALVVDDGRHFDVLYGNLKLEDGLLWLKRKGETQ